MAATTPAPRAASGPNLRVWARLAIAIASGFILIGGGMAWATYSNFTASVPHGDNLPPLAPGAKDLDGADQNILLLGNDSRAGATPAELKALGTQDDGGSVNTDTMMLLHIPAKGGKATVISFPRDSWVDIPDNGKGKINSAYGDGYTAAKGNGKDETDAESAGISLLAATLSELTGLHIDHYVQVNLLGFYRISNAIGGVTVCLNAAQNPTTDKDQFGAGYSGINLPAGISVIKGSQALAFVRQRHGLPNGDLDRVKRQQYFLSAAFHKITTAGVLLNPFKLRDLMKAVSSSLLTDPSLNLASLGTEFADMSSGNITYETLPNDGPQTIYPDGVETAIVGVDTAAIPGFINTLRGLPADPALAGAVAAAPAAVTLDVLNGTSTAGLAGRNATVLKAGGFHVDTIDSTDATAKTAVEYPAGQEGQAKAVAKVVPGAQLVLTDSVKKVTLVLGADGLEVTGAENPTTGATKPSVYTGGAQIAPAAFTVHTAATASTPAVSTPAPAANVPAGVACIN
jgi:LCP family protein required for cell wall assembly